MSARNPQTVDEMIAWLRANPGEPFRTSYSAKRLLVGTRSDTGELMAWDCYVDASACELVAPKGSSNEGGETT